MKHGLRISTVVLVFWCACFGFAHAAAPTTPVSCIWFADKEAIYQVAPDTNQVTGTIALDKAHSLAMNGCGVWAISGKQLHQFDADGVRNRQIALNSLSNKFGDTTQAVVDPYDGSIWLSDNKTLVHVDANGRVIATATAPGNIAKVLVALDQSVWVFEKRQLWHYSPHGDLLATLDLHQLLGPEPKYAALDSIGEALWLAGEKQLTQIRLNHADPLGVQIALPETAYALDINPRTGEVWVAAGKTLLSYAWDGAPGQAIDLKALDLDNAGQTAFDPVSQSLWVAANRAVGRFSAQGGFIAGITTKNSGAALAAPAFVMTPTLSLIRPPSMAITNNPTPTISYGYGALCNNQPCGFAPDYYGSYLLTATLNQAQIGPFVFDPANGQASFTPSARLPEGTNTLTAQATDEFGHTSNIASDVFTVDTIPPKFLSLAPAEGSVMHTPAVTIQGVVDDVTAGVWLSGVGAPANTTTSNGNLNFSFPVTLNEGLNTFNLLAWDQANNNSSSVLHLTLAPPPPAAPVAANIAAAAPGNGTVTLTGSPGAVGAGLQVAVTNERTQQTVTVTADANGGFSATIDAQTGDVLTVRALDQWGGASPGAPFTVAVANTGPVPPDPATVAPPIDPTVPTRMADSTAFLYTGPDAIQTGVAPGTIEAKRVTVMRGKVMTRDNQPLPGVTITVLGHPEYGQTGTRTDGVFDIAANGGGYLTIEYSKAGYLPVQRTIDTPWQDFVAAPDVVMVALDAQATAISLGAAAPMQVARGSVVTDQDGTRQATLLFPPGTTATMVLPDGTTQALTAATVRATEYTVGENGPQAMPGALPATSGYTYAAEYSLDEAIAAGATSVQFNQPVYQYLDNFLGFPVGGIVPAGYYDRQKAAWIPSDNGVIVKILSVSGGIATLDSTGSGMADSAARLAALNITNNERMQLASLYAAGKSLWRVPLTHFTPWDYNWPYWFSDGAAPPKLAIPGISDNPPIGKPDCGCNSIIDIQNRTLGESAPIAGTPFSLNYQSGRMPGHDAYSVRIPLSGASLPPNVKRIDLVVAVAGRYFTRSFPASLNQSYTFAWDGIDAYGRRVQGEQQASVSVGYVYELVYLSPQKFQRSFAGFGSGVLTARRGYGFATLWQRARVGLGAWRAPAVGLGGWTLDVQHGYETNGQVLHSGDGSTRSARALNNIIRTVTFGSAGTGAGFYTPHGMAIDAQGNLFVTERGNNRVRKVTPDGIISTVAGNGKSGWNGVISDGGPATEAVVGGPTGVAVDARGNLYIATGTHDNRIRKVTPDGIIHTVAGNGIRGFGGDGGPATAAALNYPQDVIVDTQGNLYIADSYNHRIRKVTPDGIIHTVAGNGSAGFSGDGGPATAAALNGPVGLAADAQGNLYIADANNRRIRKVTPDGIIRTVAGTGLSAYSGDGGSATAARFYSTLGVAVDAQGNLYVADSFRVRRVSPDGIINTVAGKGSSAGDFGEGGPATAAALGSTLRGLTVDARGNLYIADYTNYRVRKVLPAFLAIDAGNLLIASEDGAQLYEFDAAGRHLRTLSAASGAEQYRFVYDSHGFVAQIIDGDGNVTSIERDASGNPTAIVSPDGQRTILTLDADGYLSTIANPAGETTRMTYGNGGLLTAFTNARNQSSSIAYDSRGRLVKDQNAAGGFFELARTDLSNNSFLVSMSSALGLTTRYQVENLTTGDTRRTNTQPDGSISLSLEKSDGTTQDTAADGTITTSVAGPDPRFGMQAPFTASTTVKMPSGLTNSMTATRQATLSNPNDLLSLVTQTDTATVNGKVFKTVYNAAQHQFTTTTPLNRSTVVTTDAKNRPLTLQTAGILPVNYAYDARGRLASVSQGSGAAVQSLSYTYNPEGYVDSVTDALDRTTRYGYDAAGRVRTITLPDGREIAYTYDPDGNVTSVTPPGRPSHGFGYNAIDQTTDYTPPALGAGPVATHYDYNLDKQPTKVTRPDGQTIDYAYDSFGRLSALTMPTGAITYGYKAGSGQLASIAAPDGVNLAYSYDGALLKGVTAAGPIPGALTTVYDNFFRASQIGVNGSNIAYAYDADGLLTGAGNMTLARDPGNGLVTGTTLGQLATSQSYDSFGRVSGFTAKQGATVLFDEQYQRDNAGNLTKKTVTLNGQTSVYDYAYDPAGRLTDVTKDGTATGHFEYDANGNRTLAYGIAASYDDQDRLTTFGSAQYAYTANGELRQVTNSSGTTGYEYDVTGNLKHVDLPDSTALDYLADGRNRRVGKKVNGTLVQGFLYQDQLKPAAELDAQGNVVSRFVYAGKANVPDYLVKGGVTYRILGDQLGSVRLVVDSATGQIAQRIDYDEWGNVLSDSNPGFQPFGYAGGLYDRDTGLVRFGARDYDPRVGRWTVKDPIGFGGGDTGLYAYVNGNPLRWTDPLGLEIMVCSRKVNGFPFVGNHAYPWDTTTNTAEGMRGSSGSGADAKEKGPSADSCSAVKSSKGKEKDIMDFMRKNQNNGMWFPGVNDCHNAVQDAVEASGLKYPGAPGGRLGKLH